MIKINQVVAVLDKSLKEFLRDKVILGSTFGVPLLLLLVIPVTVFAVPQDVLPNVKGVTTLGMISLLVMMTGQANLSGSIVADRERGLYRKISSMPISPYKEVLGRIIAVLIFNSLGVILFLTVGTIYGAVFTFDFIAALGFLGFLFPIFLTSIGIGLIIASSVGSESAATHVGVGLTLLTCVFGIFFPYSSLPYPFQIFSRINPLSSAHASIIFFLEGHDFIGYNPLDIVQISLTFSLSFLIFISGLLFYSKIAWKKR